MSSKKYKLSKQKILQLRDMNEAAAYNALPLDKRIQVKMPSEVVEALDTLYPDIDRSQVLTKFALSAIVRKLRFIDNPDIADWQEMEQASLDDLWEYLEEREKDV